MVIREFPPVDDADETGLLGVGGDLAPDSIILAYRSGIFPWPFDDEHLAWFAPPRRAVLFLKDVKIDKSLRKERKREQWSFAFDRNFKTVIAECARALNRTGQSGTWITRGVVRAYTSLYRKGYAHSSEAYFDGELCGGLYGVCIGGMFAGESMFYRRNNASKLALLHLVEYLRSRDVEWIDCQVMTPHLKRFGAVEVERAEYMRMLKKATTRRVKLFG